MNTPNVLIIDGQPVVIGRIVHLVLAAVPEPACRAAVVEGVEDAGGTTLRLRLLDGSVTQAADFVRKGPAGTWHWPDANRLECQGRTP